MGKTKMINAIRKLDVTVTELREIAWALDELALSAEGSHEPTDVTRSTAASLRATRERIAPLVHFPRREGASLHEIAFNRGYELGREHCGQREDD